MKLCPDGEIPSVSDRNLWNWYLWVYSASSEAIHRCAISRIGAQPNPRFVSQICRVVLWKISQVIRVRSRLLPASPALWFQGRIWCGKKSDQQAANPEKKRVPAFKRSRCWGRRLYHEEIETNGEWQPVILESHQGVLEGRCNQWQNWR